MTVNLGANHLTIGNMRVNVGANDLTIGHMTAMYVLTI